MKRLFGLVLGIAALISPVVHGQIFTPGEAKNHVGDSATVCGSIASENTADGSKGKPTFLNLDKPYPHQTFTILIWEADRAAVGPIPKTGAVCAKGTISLYHGVPEIVAHSSAELFLPTLNNDRHYTNSDGQTVHSPAYSNGGPPAGATALCRDGTYSFSQHRQGTCSRHDGVAKWL